jgi:MoxR-like ATPase
MPNMPIKPKINALLTHLNKGIYEKEEAIRLALLSSIAGESIFLLGPPGVAKSLIARRLKFVYKDASVFEYLMSRFSTPDEIFGPVSITSLKENRYERITEHYLPSAEVVFLDEIWKAGPSIQNALLTVLNEKIFRNGDKEEKVPMKALISASNELPAKNEGLEALWDRFLVRLYVDGIEDKAKFEEMITGSRNSHEVNIADDDKITNGEYQEWSEQIDKIKMPENVFNVIDVIRKKIQMDNDKEENADNQIYVSDRRWRKIVRLLRTSAFLNDRDEVDLMDCFLIKNCIWNEDGQRGAVFQYVRDVIEEYGVKLDLNLLDIKKELENIDTVVKEWTSVEKPVEYTVPETYSESNIDFYIIMDDNNRNNLIKKEEVENLKDGDNFIKMIRYRPRRDSYNDHEIESWIKKASSNNRIICSEDENDKGKEFSLKCKTEKRKEMFPYEKEVPPYTQTGWDKEISVVLTKLSNERSQIESYKKNEYKHIRKNVFVDQENAKYVENNLDNLETEITSLETEADRIKQAYHNIGKESDAETKFIENNNEQI